MQNDWARIFASASEPHWDALLRFGTSLGLNRDEAKDVLQNSLLRGLKYFAKYAEQQLLISTPEEAQRQLLAEPTGDAPRRFRGWLYTIVRNCAYDYRRKTKEKEIVLGEEFWRDLEGEAAEVHTDVTSASLEESAEKLFLQAADDNLIKALSGLNPRQKSLLYLIAEEHTYAEAAEVLGIPIGTVMSTLSRTLKKVRGALS